MTDLRNNTKKRQFSGEIKIDTIFFSFFLPHAPSPPSLPNSWRVTGSTISHFFSLGIAAAPLQSVFPSCLLVVSKYIIVFGLLIYDTFHYSTWIVNNATPVFSYSLSNLSLTLSLLSLFGLVLERDKRVAVFFSGEQQ